MSTDDPNVYQLVVRGTDASKPPQVINVTGTNPEELIDAAREMSRTEPDGINPRPGAVAALVNQVEIARFLGRWIWKGQ